MKRLSDSTKKLLKKGGKLVVIVLVLYLILSPIAAAVIYRGVFRTVGKTTGELPELCGSYLTLADGVPRTEIVFLSGENRLHGYLYRPDTSAPVGTVIVCGGVGSGADRHLPETLCFLRAGFCVFAYDATGIGESEGDSVIGLTQIRRDLLCAMDALDGSVPLPFFLYGHSAGGYAAASVAEQDNVAAAVCVAAFDSPMDIMICQAKERVGAVATLGIPFLRLEHWFVFGNEGFLSAADVLCRTDHPVAVYGASRDTVVPDSVNLYRQKDRIDNPNVTFFRLDRTHSDAWLSDDAIRYTDEVKAAYRDLVRDCGGSVPEERMSAFLASIDYRRANEPDPAFISQVVAFFSDAA